MDATWMITAFVLIDIAMMNLAHQTGVRANLPNNTYHQKSFYGRQLVIRVIIIV